MQYFLREKKEKEEAAATAIWALELVALAGLIRPS